jgi:glycine hydroxymethyltransferase
MPAPQNEMLRSRARPLRQADPSIWNVIDEEQKRQEEQINLIASENTASRAVMEAQGSFLTNKYAEGYPGARWYRGCEIIDRAESLAIERARAIFGAEHINVQPHSGSQANMAAYRSLLQAKDKLMTMSLDHGGHLSHGHKANFSGKAYTIVPYGVDRETEQLDFNAVAEIARKERPKAIVAGYSAYPRQIDFAAFARIAREVEAHLIVDMAHICGLVAAGVHPNPVPHAAIVTTTTHKTLRGPRGGMILCKEVHAKTIDRQIFPGIQGGPLMHVIAAKAVALGEAQNAEFKSYQQQVVKNCRAMGKALQEQGLRLVSGGTDTHLMMVDLRARKITGKAASGILEEAGIVVNMNAIPFDPLPPGEASGLRIGAPTVTSRGMKEQEAETIGSWIAEILASPDDDKLRREIRRKVRDLCAQFPLFG